MESRSLLTTLIIVIIFAQHVLGFFQFGSVGKYQGAANTFDIDDVYSCCISGLLKTLFIRHGERVKFEQIKFEISPFWLWIQKAKPFENKLNSTVYIGKRSADELPNDSDGHGNSGELLLCKLTTISAPSSQTGAH